jgi:hypothetical protein
MPTYSLREMTRERKREERQEIDPTVPPSNDDYWRPKTYGECKGMARPCPFVSCRYHLFLEATKSGSVRTLSGDPDSIPRTCALDVADEGGKTLEEIGDLLGLTRERVRQIEVMALEKIKETADFDLSLALASLNNEEQNGYQLHRATSAMKQVRSVDESAEYESVFSRGQQPKAEEPDAYQDVERATAAATRAKLGNLRRTG